MLQFIILARALPAESLGLLAFISIFVSFSQVIGDGGLSNAVIFFDSLSKQIKYQLYTFGLIVGTVISVVSLSLSSWLGLFFGLPDLEQFSLLIVAIIFIRICTAQPIALLQKELEFNKIALIEISSQLLCFITICILLWSGKGVSSAIYGQLVQAGVVFFLCLIIQSSSIGISLPREKELKEPIKYGCYQMLESMIGLFSRQFDQLIVLKLLGKEVLGIYSYLKDLIGKPMLQLINPVASRVLFPILVKAPENEISTYYKNALLLLCMINIPLYLGVAYFSELLLSVVLGDNWAQYHLIASLFAFTYLIMSIINPCGSLLQAVGAVRRSFYWNLAVTTLRIIVITVTAPIGLTFMLTSLLLLQGFILIVHWYFLIKPSIGLGMIDFFKPPIFILLLSSCSLMGVCFFGVFIDVPILIEISVFLGVNSALIVFISLRFYGYLQNRL
ncbi:oligosaccharide flippase family protein [Pseudoalteromonas sp. S16_S37]|nr:oligosaccharide flippase family protein [Pseudoalteromonas sp. S16_S37]